MKNILITGIGRGIGKALAEKFLAEGHNVIGTTQTGSSDITNDRLKVYKLDLSSDESIEMCARSIKESGVVVDMLINNAGGLFDDEITHVIIEKLRQTLNVNLIGTINFTEHTLPFISKNGHIINISSSAGSLSETDYHTHSHHPNQYPAYKISKAALNMYTRTLAMRLSKEDENGITVSSVHPGWVKTEMGGEEAPMTPEEAAEHIYKLAISKPETGQFWFKGEKYPW